MGGMTIREVPRAAELAEVADQTREACLRFLGENAGSAHDLLHAAAGQLHAAHVGARRAAMAVHGTSTEPLLLVAPDDAGNAAAAQNLAVRCSVTVVDLCAAALGRLAGQNLKPREWGAKEVRKHSSGGLPAGPFLPVVEPYLKTVRSPE